MYGRAPVGLSVILSILSIVSGALGAGEPSGGPKAPAAPVEGVELRTYDVRGLCAHVPDFPAPALFGQEWDPAAGSPHCPTHPFPPVSNTPRVTVERIRDEICQRIRPGSWEPGKGASIEDRAWRLQVVNTPEVHRLIAERLAAMEERRLRLSVQGLVLSVDGETAAKLRTRRAQQLLPGEVAGLIKAAGRGGVLAEPEVVCAHAQRNSAAMTELHRYVAGCLVEGGAIVPQLKTAATGTTFDVRPVLCPDGSMADLDVHVSLAGNWRERQLDFTTSAPSQDIQSGAGPDGASKARARSEPERFAGRLSLPEAGGWQLHTRVTVPLGAHTLVGMGPSSPGLEGKAGEPGRTLVVIARGGLLSGKPGTDSWTAPDDGAGRELVQATYDLGDLVWPLAHRAAPRLGMGGGRPAGLVEAPIMTYGPPGGGDLEPGAMQDMVKRAIEPASWGVGGTSIQEQDAQLIVFQAPEVQERVARFIAGQRAALKRRLVIRGLVLALDDEAAAKLRSGDRREWTPEEAEALVAAAGPKGLLAAPRIAASNLQRVCMAGTLAAAQVGGFRATAGATLPEVELVRTGWTFDARPILDLERRTADVELRFQLAGKTGERTVRQKSPQLTCSYEAPEVSVLDMRAMPRVPLGRYALAGVCERRGKGASQVAVLVRADLVELPKAPGHEPPEAA